MTKTKATTIDEYIKAAPEESRAKLNEIWKILKEVAPNAKEAIKWGSPVLEEKRILFAFSAFKDHLNFMPTRTSVEPFEKELKDYKTGKDTIQFPYDKPLPVALIKKIAKHRVKDVKENNSLWMH